MAITRIWTLADRTQDSSQATITDDAVYGGVENDRNEEAHFLVIAKMDENQVLTFITPVDNSDPLNSLSWTFTNSVDGAYRFVFFNPLFWSGVTSYSGQTVDGNGNILTYSNIVWGATAGAFYRVIDGVAAFTAVEPGVTAGWENYWAVITDFSAEVSNTAVERFIHDDIITFRYQECLLEELDKVDSDILCGVCATYEGLFKVLSMQLLLDGMNSLNWQNKQTQAEVVIVQATKKYCC